MGTAAATRVNSARWTAVRAAVRDATDRFANLVLSVRDPSVPATKDWSVAETAAHVTGIAWNYTALLARDGRTLPISDVRRHMTNLTVEAISTQLNPVTLRAYPERDPARLVSRLRSSIDEVLDMTADDDPERVVGWLGSSRLPVAGVLAHMVNELHIHGRDIAQGARLPWRIPEPEAALFFDLFLVEIVRNGYGHLLDDDRPARPGRIAVEFHSAYTSPVTMVLDSGVASAEEPDGDRDVRIRFRPAALNLVLFHRVGHVRAALTGSVVAWGRRPWLLPPFLRKVRMP